MPTRIKIEDIQAMAIQHHWKLNSQEYHNLDSELEWTCPKEHLIYSSFKKMRDNFVCPVCEEKKCKGDPIQTAKEEGVFRLLALDDATEKTGWSIFDNDKLVSSGVIEFKQKNTIERISKMRWWLSDMIDTWKPDRVAIEDIQLQKFDHGLGVETFKILGRLQGALLITCFEKGIDYTTVHVATWRSHCAFQAKTREEQKREAQLYVKNKYGVDATQDEADAICIGTSCVTEREPRVIKEKKSKDKKGKIPKEKTVKLMEWE